MYLRKKKKNKPDIESQSINILEDQPQWRDKTKLLSNLVIVNNERVVDRWMKVYIAKEDRHNKEIGF